MIKPEELRKRNKVQDGLGREYEVKGIDPVKEEGKIIIWCYCPFNLKGFPPEEIFGIRLTEEWLLRMGFEDWGCTAVSGFEKEQKFVHHNLVDGTSDLVIAKRTSNYSGVYHEEWIIKIDDDVIPIHRLEFVHDAQNATYLLTGTELAIKS